MPRMLRLHRFEGPAGLQIDEVAMKLPGKGEIRVANEAFALNYGDLYLMSNEYVFGIELPTALCDEAVGVVDAVGEGVTDHKIGDRVSTLPFMNEGYQTSGDTFVVPSEFAVPYPENLSVAQACSIWVQYLTAYFPIVELSELAADDWVLVTAGASTSGTAALEICRLLNIKTIATSRSDNQLDYMLSKGATKAIVPGADFAEKILEITGGKGVKSVYDPVGDPLLGQYANALAKNAQIFLYGKLDPSPDLVPIIPMIRSAAILRPYSIYNHIYDQAQRDRAVRFVFDALKQGRLVPEVDKVFALADYKEAYEYQVKAERRRGKIVISLT